MEKFTCTLKCSRLNYLYALHFNLSAVFKSKEKPVESKRIHVRGKSHITQKGLY